VTVDGCQRGAGDHQRRDRQRGGEHHGRHDGHGQRPEAGTTFTLLDRGGADAARFTIDSSTGALSFVAAPDFEAPGDADADNVYDVQVQVSDGSLTTTQALAVTVTNVNEAPSITSGAAASVAENSHGRRDGHRRRPGCRHDLHLLDRRGRRRGARSRSTRAPAR
jgi:hypothetical protein